MIHQLDLDGKDKVEVAIERLQSFAKMFTGQYKDKSDKEGFFLAFSGGKDSVVIKKLCDIAGVKYDAHYSVTTVDPPELVRFIFREYPDVIPENQKWEKDGRWHRAGDKVTMWNLIPEKGYPPTRIARYCCQFLKESAGDGRLTVTGVRWAESTNRKNNHGVVTVMSPSKKEADEMVNSGHFMSTTRGGVVLVNDNEESREAIEHCFTHRKTVLNPIIDWTDEDVWEFIKEYNVPYCELYDQGYKRLGCVGCPMSYRQAEELEKYPAIKERYMRAFEKMLITIKKKNNETTWKTPQEVMRWWIGY